jgi:hypothetical protein
MPLKRGGRGANYSSRPESRWGLRDMSGTELALMTDCATDRPCAKMVLHTSLLDMSMPTGHPDYHYAKSYSEPTLGSCSKIS